MIPKFVKGCLLDVSQYIPIISNDTCDTKNVKQKQFIKKYTFVLPQHIRTMKG